MKCNKFFLSLFTNVNMESARQKFGGCVAPIFTLHPCGKSFKHWSTSATSTSTVTFGYCWIMLWYVSPCILPFYHVFWGLTDPMTWMCDSHIPCIAHIPHIPSPSHVGPMRTWQQMCGILTPSVCDLKFQISGTTSPIDSQHMAWMMIWIYRSFPSAMQWVVKSEHNQNTLFWTWI